MPNGIASLRAGVALAAAALLGSCDDGPLAPDGWFELNRAIAQWERTAAPDYSFTFVRGCFCLYEGRLRVTVRADTVSVVVMLDPFPMPPGYEPEGITIPGIFAEIAQALGRGREARVRASYDATHGFPIDVSLDRWVNAVDDEVHYEVSDLVFETLR